jgi:hypothetical protein
MHEAKGKVTVPIKHHTMKRYGRVEVELHTFSISALDGGEHVLAAFPPAKEPPVSTGQKTEWALEPLQMLWRREISLASTGNQTNSLVVQSIA